MSPTPSLSFPRVRDRFDLSGRSALVTGGAGGIGRATAAAFADLGANVAVADVPARQEDARAVADGITTEFGVTAIAIAADVTDESAVNGMVSEVSQRLGSLDIVHSNAGIISGSDAPDMPLDEWERMLRVNLTSMFLVNRASGALMRAANIRGSIINTASMSASIVNQAPEGSPHAVAYTTAKAGVKHLTKAMAMNYAPDGIRVNSVSPGVMISGIHDALLRSNGLSIEQFQATARGAVPLGRYGSLEEIGGIVAFLATDLASFITGADFLVDGGTTVW